MSGQVRQLFSFIKKLSARTSGQLYEATVPAKQLPPSATSMQLSSVVRKLNGFAPTSMAGSWDNVGLLVEPSPPLQVSLKLCNNLMFHHFMHKKCGDSLRLECYGHLDEAMHQLIQG